MNTRTVCVVFVVVYVLFAVYTYVLCCFSLSQFSNFWFLNVSACQHERKPSSAVPYTISACTLAHMGSRHPATKQPSFLFILPLSLTVLFFSEPICPACSLSLLWNLPRRNPLSPECKCVSKWCLVMCWKLTWFICLFRFKIWRTSCFYSCIIYS